MNLNEAEHPGHVTGLHPQETSVSPPGATLAHAAGWSQFESSAAAGTLARLEPANDAFSFWKLPEQWREPLAQLSGLSEPMARHLLLEEYLEKDGRRPPAGLYSCYYRVKRLVPEGLRHWLNALVVRSRRQREFPRWPCESALLEFWRQWLHDALARLGASTGWHIGFWPGGRRCAIVLTHDVESPLGLKRVAEMAALEESYGFRSAWNVPLGQYPIDWSLVARLKARGFEFGAHGLRHDGALFRDLRRFASLAPELEKLARCHGLRGFRAPSTLRRADWITMMNFEFDSSFADTDPYEPQPGGSCSLFPFHLGATVELPYTLAQDHTLLHILRREPLAPWLTKARWIASLGGMILSLTHPDYVGAGRYLAQYEELLRHLAAIDSAWRALPSEVARWWRQRAAMRLVLEDGRPQILGAGAESAAARPLAEEPLAR
jgi:peptidoglycan/xylan/chitin deacetylase (PgdA/CDA1 family)